MIDLRKVDPLEPAHLSFDFEGRRWSFSCREMEKDPKDFYHCTNNLCGLAYGHFLFIGYYKNPKLPFPQITYPENIADKAMVCKPRCSYLKSSNRSGFYECQNCGGNFMKHPDLGVISIPADWLQQDPRALKYFILKAQKSSANLHKEISRHSSPELRKRLFARYKEAEKIFVTEILSKCRL